MAIVHSPFKAGGRWPIDERLVVNKTSAMSAMDESKYPAGYITVNTDPNDTKNNGLWVYLSANSASEETGKWRKITDESQLKDVWTAISATTDAISAVWTTVSSIETSASRWNKIPEPTWVDGDDKFYAVKNNTWVAIPTISAGDNISITEVDGVSSISAKNTTDCEWTTDGLLKFLHSTLNEHAIV